MFEINGKYASAKVFADTAEPSATGKITALCDQPFAENSRIRIMPDMHAGKGYATGTTMTVTDKIVPNLVGVDIGYGMETAKLKEKRINLPKLDSFIRGQIPSGFSVRERPHRGHGRIDIE